nr:hypothetical protein [Tanacetum cinerariifolium]
MDDQKDASKQGGIAKLDADKDVTLVDAEEEMDVAIQGEPAEVEEVIEVVIAAKLIPEVVTTAATTITIAQVPKASAPRRRKGVVIHDPEETATSSIIVHSKVKYNDKGKVKRKEKHDNTIMSYQALKRKPVTEAHARKNMMIYLKNIAGFKMDFFKGMTYIEIRPIFEKHYKSILAFLEKGENEIEEEGNKRKSENLEQRAAKKQRIDEEVEELKTHLEIIPNDEDDVYTKATPLALKVPIVDYQIHHEHNKPYYKIIRVDGTHQLFLSFITLLNNFDREDLEMLWKLVQERLQSSEPNNFLDDFLLNTFKTMFQKPNMILLVERKYPLTRFTLEQILNNVRLEVEEESEMSLELLSSDDNKGISSEGPSITSIPKEGPSIARRSTEPILKELLEVMENQSDVQNYLVEIQADDHDLLVNSDNENDDMLGYESEKYSDDEDADGTNHAKDKDGTNHSDLKLGIRVTQSTIFEFLDLVREHIVIKLVMHRLGKLLRNFRMKLREKYILSNLNTPSKLNEPSAKYSEIVKAEEWVEFVNYTTTDAYKKGRVNKDREFTDDEIRLVGDKLKEADDKIKEGTLNLDDGTDAITVVFGKEKGGYARGIGSGVTYKRYFDLPRSRQATNERIELLQTQLDNKRHEHQQKDVFIKKLSIEITEKDEPVKTVRPKKTPKSQRNGSQDSQSQMLHNQALPNDYYKVSINSSLVDAACIPNVGNNGLKTVKDGIGGFIAWPKN